MNHSSTARWSPMISGQDDFDHLLDFSDLQLDYAAYSAAEAASPHVPADVEMDSDAGMVGLKRGEMEQEIDHDLLHMVAGLPEMNQGSTDSLLDLEMEAQFFHPEQHHQYSAQQQPQQPQPHPHYRRHGQVPPTPTSMEMNGVRSHAYPVESRVIRDAYSGKPQNHLMFTPLVSPAVTPLETQIHMPGYSTPKEYFSPLTSPALEAQSHAGQRSVYGAIRGSDTSDTTSPLDKTNHGADGSAVAQRKSKRKSMSSSTKPAARTIRNSPAMKPQRKKQLSSSVIPSKELAEMIEDARASKQNGRPHSESGKLSLPGSQYSSEAGSISPEPLNEIMMPPPAPPGSVGRSPHLKAQCHSHPAPMRTASPMRTVMNAPATPASLMRIRKTPDDDPRMSATDGPSASARPTMARMDDPSRPAAVPNTDPPPVDTDVSNDDQITPTIPAKKARSSAPTPVSSTVLPSPSAFSVPSPIGPTFGKRGEPKGRRGGKRAGSTHLSPALRPRISPSIKPLLPEGTLLTAETSALLLASKSNYQNILEGTHLPGVEYPEALSENLSSKRTSHKLAEQGRRNRINNALQEMAALLPAGGTPMLNGREPTSGEGVPGAAGSSKASTVEIAIEYIKALQAELKDAKTRLGTAEEKLRQPHGPQEA